MKSHTRFTALIVMAIILFTCGHLISGAAVDTKDFSAKPNRKADRATVSVNGKALVVRIQSAIGIGALVLKNHMKAGTWPQIIRLYLVGREGKPLRELEGFTLQSSRLRVQGSRRTAGKMDAFDFDLERKQFPKKPTRQVNIVVKKSDEALLVEIPSALVKDEKKLTIQWIDFYR